MSATPRTDNAQADLYDEKGFLYLVEASFARELEIELTRLRAAANAIYEAGHWTCDRPVDDVALWTELRDALKRSPGGAPKPTRAGDA